MFVTNISFIVITANLIASFNFFTKTESTLAVFSAEYIRTLNTPTLNTIKTIDGGEWIYDPTDKRSKDNTGTILVTNSGLRYKRKLKDSTVNITWFGADKSGQKDCSTQLRSAQAVGNVYFPTGTYLMSPVDLKSNRKYFGDGVGKSIVKAKHTKIKMLWGLSTYDFDKSNHASGNLENLSIQDLTFDYNLDTGWIDYFSIIIFKGKPGTYIKNVKIQRVEFIDSKQLVHPDATGGNGKDAWSINLSSYADSTSDIVIDQCLSNAESHQFVGGGGSNLNHVAVTNNYIVRPHANGIAFTTVSNGDAAFSDFTVTGNTIIDPFGSAILFGNDPGTLRSNGGKQTFEKLLVANNKISFANYTCYGRDYRTKKSFPYVINLSGAEPYMKDITVKDNIITVSDDYAGGDICLAKIRSYRFKRDAVTLTDNLIQPAVNGTVAIPLRSVSTADGKPLYQQGSLVNIDGGGKYIVADVQQRALILKLLEPIIKPGNLINKGSNLNFTGGILQDIQFVNNRVNGKKMLKIIPGGNIANLTFQGNNRIEFIMLYKGSVVNNAQILNNQDLSFDMRMGVINGIMSGNKLRGDKAINTGKKIKAIVSDTDATPAINNLKMFNNN